MSDTDKTPPSWETLTNDERQSALFANLVMQQTNAALLMLGKVPHPESGKSELDLDGASLFIDTLEMLQGKTRGNLGKHEEAMLKQSLTMLRMAYVEKVNAAPNVDTDATKPVSAAPPPAPSATDSSDAESKKKFTKKY